MKPLTRTAVATVLLMLVGGCDAKPAQPAPPPSASSQSDVPPPLVPIDVDLIDDDDDVLISSPRAFAEVFIYFVADFEILLLLNLIE